MTAEDRQARMERTADHDRGRRCPRVGDLVLDPDTKTSALVVDVDRKDRGYGWASATVLLEWQEIGGVRLSRRKASTMRKLRLLEVDQPVDMSAPAEHRRGRRAVEPGDVLRDPADHEREALVVSVGSKYAHLSWRGSGRSTRRLVASLRALELKPVE